MGLKGGATDDPTFRPCRVGHYLRTGRSPPPYPSVPARDRRVDAPSKTRSRSFQRSVSIKGSEDGRNFSTGSRTITEGSSTRGRGLSATLGLEGFRGWRSPRSTVFPFLRWDQDRNTRGIVFTSFPSRKSQGSKMCSGVSSHGSGLETKVSVSFQSYLSGMYTRPDSGACMVGSKVLL